MNDDPKSKDTVDAEYQLIAQDDQVPGIETYRMLMRLLIGGVLVGSDELLQRLKDWETENAAALTQTPEGEDQEPDSAMDRLRYAMIGLAFEAPEVAMRGALRTVDISTEVGQKGAALAAPLTQSFLFKPFRSRYESLQSSARASVDRWTEVGRREEPTGRQVANDVVPQTIDDVVTALADNEAIQDLIRIQAGDYLAYLNDHPAELEDLVQVQGDSYVKYLHDENPDDVQDLIAGQTIGMTTEIMDEVRERTVTADSVVELILRSLLKRTPRVDLPGPSPEVLNRSQVTRQSERKQSIEGIK